MNLFYLLNDYLKKIGVNYAICGGSAIDLFIGHKTRPHKDLDVAVYWDDRDEIVQYMLKNGWNLYEPCGCQYLHKINSVKDQKRVKSNVWCIKLDNPHYKVVEREKGMYEIDFDGSEQTKLDFIEFLFNNHDSENFIYARNHSIKRELYKAIIKTNDVCYLAPELILLYKSTGLNNSDYQHDYNNALTKMNEDQITWLENALVCMFPEGHAWVRKI